MDVAEFLRRRETPLDEVVRRVAAALRLHGDDVLFLCGSLVEGLGNDRSDFDCFLITSRDDVLPGGQRETLVPCGSFAADVRIVCRGDVDDLLSRFSEWAAQPRNERRATAFTWEERKLLHRIRVGRSLSGAAAFESLQMRIPQRDLARLRLDVARSTASQIQVDLSGLQGEGDVHSLIVTAQELLIQTVEALLAGHGETNANGKWRMRHLAAMPADWERALPGRRSGLAAPDLVVSLNRAPDPADAAEVLAHAQRITHFSRRVFGWAEWRLLCEREPSALLLRGRARDEGPPLPHLDLDVVMRFDGDRFAMMRVNGSGEVFRLLPEEYALLCMFDGETSRARAAAHARATFRSGAAKVTQMLALIEYAGLQARPMIDRRALRALLGESADLPD